MGRAGKIERMGGGDGGGGGTGGECGDVEIFDCFGNCAPAAWLGDGYCDESMADYNCLELAYDMGDEIAKFTKKDWKVLTDRILKGEDGVTVQLLWRILLFL